MWNICLRSGGGEILGGGLVSSLFSAHGIKLGFIKGCVGGTLIGISGGET